MTSIDHTIVFTELCLKNVLKFLMKDLSPKDYLILALEVGSEQDYSYDKILLENPKNSDGVLAEIIDLWIKNLIKPKALWEWLRRALLEIQPNLAHKISNSASVASYTGFSTR